MRNPVKIIVTGGRDYNNAKRVDEVLTALDPCLVIQGGAKGADLLAFGWALQHKKAFRTYAADWTKNGKRAGPLRNQEMCFSNRDAIVVAFPGGAGTANCIAIAKQLKMTVLLVEEK